MGIDRRESLRRASRLRLARSAKRGRVRLRLSVRGLVLLRVLLTMGVGIHRCRLPSVHGLLCMRSVGLVVSLSRKLASVRRTGMRRWACVWRRLRGIALVIIRVRCVV